MSIAKITDVGPHILLASTLRSAADVTSPLIGPAGVITGTATLDAEGLDPGSAGSVSFSNIDPKGQLKYAGQIVATFTTPHVCEYDDSSSISGSEGFNWAATAYMFALENAAGANQGRMFMSSNEAITSRLHSGDTQAATQITTSGKGVKTEICWWWKGTEVGILANGSEVYKNTRTVINEDVFYKLICMAEWAGLNNPMTGAKMIDLVASRIPPNFATKANSISIGDLGDSYANQFVTASYPLTTPRFDGLVYPAIEKEVRKGNTYSFSRIVEHGYSGYTMCDTVGNNLQPKFAAFVAEHLQVAIITVGQNDAIALQANVTNATTGTDARFKELLGLLAVDPANELIVITNSGSLRNHVTLDTTINRETKAIVDNIIAALPAWFDQTYPARAGSLIFIDQHAILGGDSDTNLNYQGYLNSLGNVSTPGVAIQNDRHRTGLGCYNTGTAIGKEIKRYLQL